MCCVLVAQLCPTLCNHMDCSPPESSVHEISQARILEWVAVSSSRGSSQPKDRTASPALAGGFFTTEPPGKPQSRSGCMQISCAIPLHGWHHRFNGHESEQTPGDTEGEGSLACCSPWGLQRVGHDLATER